MTQTLTKELLMQLKANVSSGFFGSFPLSCLLIGLEALMDLEFSCPCRMEWNHVLSNLIITAPACFAFVLMFLWLRPCGCKVQSWKCDSSGLCDKAIQDGVKSFLHCLIPPVVWFFLVLYDGSYYTCSQTDWDGVYVHDEVLGKKWCKPTDGNSNYEFRELQLRNQSFVDQSQLASYILVMVFCAVTFVLVCVYDCRINCTCCGNEQQDSEETVQEQCSESTYAEMNEIRNEVQPQFPHVQCSVNDI
ncbi:calcium homeostasis modulator protein 5-like [Triplophysa dalaica]|uniref:calcium homeostasis modulator protein 5-like n=1 Tax=Triplophysa dalaica TaxID=1582913 RepID=UPI0024DFEFF9|nr:calcium homeostasis modulator protein 5-like [Triplophysa dalaica]